VSQLQENLTNIARTIRTAQPTESTLLTLPAGSADGTRTDRRRHCLGERSRDSWQYRRLCLSF